MLGNRALLNKQRKQAERQSTAKNSENEQKVDAVSSFQLPKKSQDFIDLPLQTTFRQEKFDEDSYIQKLLEEVYQSELLTVEDDKVANCSIEEIDQLVDFSLSNYIIEHCLKRKIQQEMWQIWQNQTRQNDQKNSIDIGQISNQDKNQIFSMVEFMKSSNQTAQQLLSQIDHLSHEKGQLEHKFFQQQNELTKAQIQIHQIKDKYLSLLKQFTQFKKQTQQKDSLLTESLEQKSIELISCRQTIKMLEEKNQLAEAQLKELKNQNERQIQSLTQRFSQYYSLEILHFITLVNGLIEDAQRPIMTLYDTLGLSSNFQSISNQLDQIFKSHQDLNSSLISSQSSAIKSLKNLLKQSHQFIMEVNSLEEYELKVQRKDLNNQSSAKSSKNSLNDDQDKIQQQTNHLIQQILYTIKNQMINQANITQKLIKISKVQTATNQIGAIPIQMLNHSRQTQKISVNKSIKSLKKQNNENLVQQFSIEEQSSPQSPRINYDSDDQLLLFKQQNQSLKQQIQTLKAQLQKQLKTQDELKSLAQRAGKIKKVSAKQQISENNQENKENNIVESNKISHNKKLQSNDYKCQNHQCKQKCQQRQAKLSQFKQNIINLNQIINYVINHLKGYHFANLINGQTQNYAFNRNKPNEKTFNQFYIREKGLPVRKFSYLDNQLEQIRRDEKKQCEVRLNTVSSFNQTTQSIILSNNLNPKQVGKITSVHQSLNNTQTKTSLNPTIKPHIIKNTQNCQKTNEYASKIISKQTVRQNFENFEFIRKLCLKQRKCKDLITKFHSYLDFYLHKIEQMQLDQFQGHFELQNEANNTIDLENASNIWQSQDNEIEDFESSMTKTTSNYGIKMRSLNSSHSRASFHL